MKPRQFKFKPVEAVQISEENREESFPKLILMAGIELTRIIGAFLGVALIATLSLILPVVVAASAFYLICKTLSFL